MQAHFALDDVHGLVARVDVKLAAVFAAAGDEAKRVRTLPQHGNMAAGLGKLSAAFHEIYDGHGKHG
jgi:hypothetical protein